MRNKIIEKCSASIFCEKSLKSDSTPKYVKKQMSDFMAVWNGENEKYVVSLEKLRQLENILKILIMPKGLKAGQTLYECTTGYQWLFYTAVLCTVYRDNQAKRRYETGLLEICRKNFKTYTISTIFLMLFLTEPQFSKFFSVAPDFALSTEIKEAMGETIKSSPLIFEFRGEQRFKILRDYILFKPKQTKYIPLSFSNNRMDGRLPNVFIADEVGALPSNYAIEAMKSGQLNILNKLGFIVSTKYDTLQNPFEDEVLYSKKILDGTEKDETRFSLLYEPDITKGWETNDLILKQANPVALEIPEIWKDLLKKRSYAIAVENARSNFVTKHCNIIYRGATYESYIDVNDLQACKVDKINWDGVIVYLGLDLSESGDNTSVSMVGVDENNNVLAASFAFLPEGKINSKSIKERVNYYELTLDKRRFVRACGDKVIDYAVVEDFIMNLEKDYGVSIAGIAYDRYNAISTVQKLNRAGYNTIELKQHSSVLHSPTKLLKEKILEKKFKYEENKLLEINFQNARCAYDTNKNMFVNKLKSNGKVDMVVSLIDAMYLLEQDVFLNQADFLIQTG